MVDKGQDRGGTIFDYWKRGGRMKDHGGGGRGHEDHALFLSDT